MVVGDLMVDRYLKGKAERISPEAPVPVFEAGEEENRPGGAANVALNLQSMGARVLLGGIIGRDEAGEVLRALAQNHGFATEGIYASPHRCTTVKTRIMAGSQQLLRIDREDRFDLLEEEKEAILPELLRAVAEADALILEDYNKGLLTPEIIRLLTDAANQSGIPVLVDPKFRNFTAYHHTAVFKPNLKELNEALGKRLGKDDLAGLESACRSFMAQQGHKGMLLTLSELGVLWVAAESESTHISAHQRAVADVSGAGDTVIALMALGLAGGLSGAQSAWIANLGGGLVCEEVGVAPIRPERLLAGFRGAASAAPSA